MTKEPPVPQALPLPYRETLYLQTYAIQSYELLMVHQ
jgi:hypothetical protein